MNPLRSIIGQQLFLLSFFILITTSCWYVEEEKWKCILNCNPSECLMLDEENCKCIPDPICLTEEFCSGEIEDCRCKEEDGGSWCTALTGDSIKTWKFAFAYDPIRNDTVENMLLDYNIWATPDHLHRYQLNHVYIEYNTSSYSNPDIYSWTFDNSMQPEKIIYKRIKTKVYNVDYELERSILKLNQDTLISTWMEGIFPGWIVLVPDDSLY